MAKDRRLLPKSVAWLILIPVLMIAAAVFATASVQWNTAIHAGGQADASQEMLTAMLLAV